MEDEDSDYVEEGEDASIMHTKPRGGHTKSVRFVRGGSSDDNSRRTSHISYIYIYHLLCYVTLASRLCV